jgi:hypothetical protein
MILFLNPYWSNNFIKLLANVCLVKFVCLKQTKSYLFGLLIKSHLKFITRANISCVPSNIHESKLVVTKIQSINFGKIYTCFIFSTKLGNSSRKNYFLEGKTTLKCKCNIKHLNHKLPTNYNGKLFFIIKRPRSCKKSFYYTSSFLKGSFTIKITRNCTC